MPAKNFKGILRELISVRNSFGPEFQEIKSSLLSTASKLRPASLKDLIPYHELLLFMMAYPDSKEIYKTAIDELRRVSILLKTIARQSHSGHQTDDTGMAHTTVTVPPSLSGAQWIIESAGKDVSPVWDAETIEKIGPQLSLFAIRSEMDGLTNNRFDALDWMRIKSGDEKKKQPHLVLKWITQSVKSVFTDLQQQDQFWEQLSISVKVNLSQPTLSRTLNFIESEKPFLQNSLLIRSIQVQDYINDKNYSLIHPDHKTSAKIIRSGKAALLARGRETDPVTYAQKVTEVMIGRGLSVFLFTMKPERRLPLENYTGFVAYKNGVPVGYGGGWIFGFRCEIGVNIFESFRGGENYLLFSGIMKAYKAVFNVKKFTVAPYQFGEDNEEGIKTGAYWFYYKLGFRSADQDIAALAEKEALKMKNKPGYKSAEKTLLKFTEAPLYFHVDRNYSITEPAELGICISRWITSEFNGDHNRAQKYSESYILGKLPPLFYKTCNKSQKDSFRSLAPLIAMTQCLDGMNRNEVLATAEMMKEKGQDEIRHTIMLQNNHTLTAAFKKAAKKYGR